MRHILTSHKNRVLQKKHFCLGTTKDFSVTLIWTPGHSPDPTLNGMVLQLPADDRILLDAICSPVELASGQVLEQAGPTRADPTIYFLDSATATLWIEPGRQQAMAVGLVGNEALVGCSHLWSSTPSQWAARVLMPGRALATSPEKLRGLMAQSPTLVLAMSQQLWRQMQEIAQLSARMMLGDVRTRLALWLHLIHYKTGQTTLSITHDALARMLGTRRVSITLAAGELQSEGVISLHRGMIVVQDIRALARIAALED